MSIRRNGDVGKKGSKDARRHRDKQRGAIKEGLPVIISEESIITNRKNKKVKIPIRSINIPVFRPGHRRKDEAGEGGAIGIGQGQGKPGTIIGRRESGKGKQPGGAGEDPGEDYIETEIEMEELIEMMMEDMGLPNIQKKKLAEMEVSLGFKVSGLRKTGPRHMLFSRQTMREGLKTFWRVFELLKTESGLDEKICYWALQEADGSYEDALELLKQVDIDTIKSLPDDISPFPIFDPKDMRYLNLKEETKKESNAAVFIMLDVSGSMGLVKKYIARSMMFWLTEFLRKLYSNVAIRFVIYHSESRVVDEHTAFHTTESGGTRAVSGYDTVRRLAETEYPSDKWNVYAFHFSDGDDFVPKEAVASARKLIEDLQINMLGYIEINIDSWGKSNLMPEFVAQMPIKKSNSNETEMYVGSKKYPFVGAVIENKEDMWPIIKELLRKDRWLA